MKWDDVAARVETSRLILSTRLELEREGIACPGALAIDNEAIVALDDRIAELERAAETLTEQRSRAEIAAEDARRMADEYIAEAERAAETTRAEHAAALGLATARIRELEGERDELLGMLREQALGEQCDVAESTDDNDADQSCMDTLDDDGVPRPDVNQPCWEHRRRAIVARIEKATKGTR